MTQIVEGKKIADKILFDLQVRVKNLKAQGKEAALAVILVGDDKPSHTYVRKKGEAAQNLGITFFKFEFPADISKADLIAELKKIQADNKLTGLILQLPVPERLWPDTREIVDYIEPGIDVDCLSHLSLGRVMMADGSLLPPTPGAILEILKFYEIDLTGQDVCLVGRGDLIGKPLAAILNNQPVTLHVCGRATKDLSIYTKAADIIITGVGKKDLLTGAMVKTGAVVIDAGVCFDKGKMFGDIEFASVAAKASLVTPTPGGVGPITVAKLLENVVIVAENN